jgi:hypothetical protein
MLNPIPSKRLSRSRPTRFAAGCVAPPTLRAATINRLSRRPPNTAIVLLVLVMLLGVTPPARADLVTITSGNSSVLFNGDDQAVDSVDWIVDGRTILVYRSTPLNIVDLAHHHAEGHTNAPAPAPALAADAFRNAREDGFFTFRLGTNQAHGAGQFPIISTAFSLAGQVLYTVIGGAPGSGESILKEWVILDFSVDAASSITVVGAGFLPGPHGSITFPIPDLTGLSIVGTTAVFDSQVRQLGGNSLFSGFNTFSLDVPLAAGDTRIFMATEFHVATLPNVPEPVTLLLVVPGLAAVAWRARRRQSQRHNRLIRRGRGAAAPERGSYVQIER